MRLSWLVVGMSAALAAVSCGGQGAGGTDVAGDLCPGKDLPDAMSTDAGPTPHLHYVKDSARKICQLTGDLDMQSKQPTLNLTFTNYMIYGTDLGTSFRHHDRTYFLFGDTVPPGLPPDGDAIAWSTDSTPEDCLELTFLAEDGVYSPITIPGVSQGAFEVPTAGVGIGDSMYIWFTTGHTDTVDMGRSVVARSLDDGKSFAYVRDFSSQHFINAAVVKHVFDGSRGGLPAELTSGHEYLVVFGSGEYRKSAPYLAILPSDSLESGERTVYFAGAGSDGGPLFSQDEEEAEPLYPAQCIGEISAFYNAARGLWFLLYNCGGDQRGIHMLAARRPWGTWSASEVVFDPWADGGYCGFMHVSWEHDKCDNVNDPMRENEWGGEYGPYVISALTRDDGDQMTVYYTMSTWNPYAVVLMESTVRIE